MNGLVRSTLLIFSTHLVRTLRTRRAAICGALAWMPAALAFGLAHFRTRMTPGGLATNLGWLLLLQIVVPLLALIAGSAVVAEEVEDRTITYFFSRPIPRASVLLGRWLATVVFLDLLLGTSTACFLWACSRAEGEGAPLASDIVLPLFTAVCAGGAVYSGLFTAAGVFFKHPMIVGLGYTFAIEGFLSNLPGKTQTLTIQYHLRSWIAAGGSSSWREVEGLANSHFESAADASLTLALVLFSALAIGSWQITRREFVLTA